MDLSFSSDTKEELCSISIKNECCEKAQCYAMLIFSKYFLKLSAYIGNEKVSQWLSSMLCILTSSICRLELHYMKKNYILSIPDDCDKENILQFFNHKDNKINMDNLKCESCKIAFLRGAFMTCGNISDPSKQYKFEYNVFDKNLSVQFLEILESVSDKKFKTTKRAESFVVYTKDSSHIEELLAMIGATKATMNLMQEKMYKEEKNRINRQINSETANMDKSFSASAKQIAAIATLFEICGNDCLEKDLYDIALMRVENPELSLKQLSEKMGISKSSLNHRLNKIVNLSNQKLETSLLKN